MVSGSGSCRVGPATAVGGRRNGKPSIEFAGWGDRAYNRTLIQPLINYNLPNGWYVNSVSIITADWENRSGGEWLVPLGAGVGKILRLGKLPVNAQLGVYDNVVTPDNGTDWQLRVQVQFLFPK